MHGMTMKMKKHLLQTLIDCVRGKEIQMGSLSEKTQPMTESIFYILLAVRKPNHGYGIIQEVERLTGGRVTMGAGTLYGAIQTLEKKGWIAMYSQEQESRKKKEYQITEVGKEAFRAETERLKELLENAQLADFS